MEEIRHGGGNSGGEHAQFEKTQALWPGLSTVNHKMVESDKFCRSLPKMGQVLEFAKIRV
jgi:hypothetical protein